MVAFLVIDLPQGISMIPSDVSRNFEQLRSGRRAREQRANRARRVATRPRGIHRRAVIAGLAACDGSSAAPGSSGRIDVGLVVFERRCVRRAAAAGSWDANSIAPVTAPDEPPYEFVGKSTAIVVDPFDASTVWLGTGNKGLFKSSDCGATWAHVNR